MTRNASFNEYAKAILTVIGVVRFGGVEAAIFILLTTLNKQMEFEKSADIYMYAKLLYMKRPGVFRTKVFDFAVCRAQIL